MFNIMKCLVTGGAGFIGSNFITQSLDGGFEVLNFDNLTYAGNLMNLSGVENSKDYSFVRGDICDKKSLNGVFDDFMPEVVINFAAESHVDRSILEPEDFVRTNVLGTQNLLKFSLEYGVERFIQVSTDEVYGSLGETGFFTEETPLNPHSPYSASKASADHLVNAYYDTYGLPVNITRCSNNFGPYQFPEKLIPLAIVNLLEGRKIPVYGDGLNVRDWIHVKDHCSAIMRVIEDGVKGEVYNIGANNERRNIDLIKLIIAYLSEIMPDKGIDGDLLEFIKDRPGHDRRYAIDSGKIHSQLGWKPEISFEQGLKDTIKWYLANDNWLKSVLNKDYERYYERNYSKRG
jgi:dTDP-glucose 4,6-dehydratase